MEMRKVLLVFALMAVAMFSLTTVKEADATARGVRNSASQNVSRRAGICAKIFSRCGNYCLTGTNDEAVNNCWSACVRGYELCEKVVNTWPGGPRIAADGNGEGNIKDFPSAGGSKLKVHANPNAGGMSTMQGGAATTTPAASRPVSTPLNAPSSSSNSKPAGGSGLLSRPGMPRLRAQ
jgi:hypothetical protein